MAHPPAGEEGAGSLRRRTHHQQPHGTRSRRDIDHTWSSGAPSWDDDLVVEAVSNQFLPRYAQLGPGQELALVALGWHPPTEQFPNFHRSYGSPVDHDSVAFDILAGFVTAYGATPDSTFYVAPAHLAHGL